MLERRLTSVLCCAALLLVFAPPSALAQTQRAAAAGRDLAAPLTARRPEFKALFAESAARARAGGPLTEADFKRFEKLRQQEEAKPPEEEKWGTGHKVLIIAAIVGSVALIVWAAANSVDNPTPFCEDDRSDPNCIL